MNNKQRRYVQYVVLAIVAIVVVAVVVISRTKLILDPVQKFVTGEVVPYQALLPSHLPKDARFVADKGQSGFDAKTGMLTLRWVFPAQTLPGQGTVIFYQYVQPEASRIGTPTIKDGHFVELTTVYGHSEATLGKLDRGDVPDSPGQAALQAVIHGRNIMIVSYAINDQELIAVADSVK